MSTLKKYISLASTGAACTFFVGCGSYTNYPIEIRDDSAIAYDFAVEARPTPRILLRGKFLGVQADSELKLNKDKTLDVVRANETLWEGPLTLNQDVEFKNTSFAVMGSPVNNDVLEFNIGGGVQYTQGELKLSANNKQANIDFINSTNATFNTELKFKFSPQFAIGGAFTDSISDNDRPSQLYELSFFWTPIENVRFNLGLFQHSYENYISSGSDSTGNYELQYRRIERDDFPNLESCEDDNADSVCPSGNYDSELDIFSQGLKAGVTFLF